MAKRYFKNYKIELAYAFFFKEIEADVWENIHDILEITSGDNLPKHKMTKGNYSVYGGGGITDNTHNKFNIDYDTIGIGRVGARCGCVFKIEKKSWVTDNALLIKNHDKRFYLDFLKHYLNYLNLGQFANNAMQPVISKTRISNIKLPVIPIAEQKRIAKILDLLEVGSQDNLIDDTLLSSKIRIVDNWEKLLSEITKQKEYVKQLKQSILQEAIQGKLTEDWRDQNPNVEPANELLKRIKAEKEKLIKDPPAGRAGKKIRKEKPLPSITEEDLPAGKAGIPFELPKGWEWCHINELADLYTGNSINKSEKEAKYTKQQKGLVYIGTKDVEFDMKGINYNTGVIIPEKELNKFKLAPKNTVLICIEGGSSGKKIGITTQNVCFGNKLLVANTYINELSGFLYYLYNSPQFKSEFDKQRKGLRGGVSVNSFKNIKIPLPPFAEQKAIVKKVETLMQKVSTMEEEIQKSEQNANMLMQAVLKEAFEGKKEEIEV